MNTQLRQVSNGFVHIWLGCDLLLKERSLRKWAIIPFLIDITLVLIGVFMGFALISDWVAAALAFIGLTGLGFWSQLATFLFSALLWIGYLIALIYGTFLVATVIAAPFHALLAERALIILGVIEDRPFHLGDWLVTSIRMLGVGLAKAALFLFIGIFIFIGSFVPGLNILSSFVAMLILAFDSMDYSFEAQRFGFFERLSRFRIQLPQAFGMAGGLAVTIFIPGLTLMLLPCSVVGSAVLVQRSRLHQ